MDSQEDEVLASELWPRLGTLMDAGETAQTSSNFERDGVNPSAKDRCRSDKQIIRMIVLRGIIGH